MMTRKDYVETAKILNDFMPTIHLMEDKSGVDAFEGMVQRFALMFEFDNPRFDADRFADACYGEGK